MNAETLADCIRAWLGRELPEEAQVSIRFDGYDETIGYVGERDKFRHRTDGDRFRFQVEVVASDDSAHDVFNDLLDLEGFDTLGGELPEGVVNRGPEPQMTSPKPGAAKGERVISFPLRVSLS